MKHEPIFVAAVGSNAEDWHREVGYHLRRAAEEQRMAARSNLPEARTVHATMARSHMALAASARMVAEAPDAEPLDSLSMATARSVMSEAYAHLINRKTDQ